MNITSHNHRAAVPDLFRNLLMAKGEVPEYVRYCELAGGRP